MGGFGSGPRDGGKPLIGDRLALDMRRLYRDTGLRPGTIAQYTWRWRDGTPTASMGVHVEALRVVIHDASGAALPYGVRIDWTRPNYGGRVPWFRCPQCARRAAILRSGPLWIRGIQGWACRRCHGLAYASQRETVGDRALRRADVIGRKLQWEPGAIGGPKPARMHWRTFERLTAMYRICEARAWEYAEGRLAALDAQEQRLLNRARR